jgi:hypothetical protein
VSRVVASMPGRHARAVSAAAAMKSLVRRFATRPLDWHLLILPQSLTNVDSGISSAIGNSSHHKQAWILLAAFNSAHVR